MKAIEIFGNQEIEVRKVEITPAYTRPTWLVEENETIDLTMCAIPKEACKERMKAEFTSLMADKYEEFDQIYADKKDEIPILNIQCRTASDHNGNEKYNKNKQTDDHSHGLS
jgi:hypothetical protein